MSRKLYLLGLVLVLGVSVAACGGKASPLVKARELAIAHDFDGAQAILEEQRALHGLTPEIGLLLGGVSEGRGKPSAAATIYRQTADENPGSGEIEFRLAELYLNLGQTEASLQRLRKARAAGEDDANVSLNMSIAHGLLGEFAEAKQELDRAEKAGAPASTIQYNRGLLLRQSGDKAASRQAFLTAHEARPEDPSILRELARAELLLVEGDDLERIIRAEEYINQSISLLEKQGREDWRCYEVIGDCFIGRKDHAAASEMYLKAKEIGEDPHPRLDDKYYDAQVQVRALASGQQE